MHLFSRLLENSSWVLNHLCWVLIQRQWLVHLARPVSFFFAYHPGECLEAIGSIPSPWWIHSVLARKNVLVLPVVAAQTSQGVQIIPKWYFGSISTYWVRFIYYNEGKGLILWKGKKFILLKCIYLSNKYLLSAYYRVGMVGMALSTEKNVAG